MHQAATQSPGRKEKTNNSNMIFRVIPSPQIQTLPNAVQKIIELFDGQRSLTQICQQAQISETKGLAVTKKLTRLGLLSPVHSSPPLSDTSALSRLETLRGLPSLGSKDFSAEEEAFFATELEVIDECNEPFDNLSEKISLFFSDFILRLRGSQVL